MNRLSAGVAVLILTASAAAQQTETKIFYVNDSMKKDIVEFTSKAPLETIVGRTGEVKGYVSVDPTGIKGTAKGRFEVTLDSLKTGINMRDQHMREKFLETAKFPKALFELTKVDSASQNTLADQKDIQLVLEGNFTVHGITRAIKVPATITYLKESDETKQRLPGDLLHIVTSFNVNLGDYAIDRPQILFLKLGETQKVDLDLFSATGLPAVDFGPK
jgi:polyisoprenoid-binding protein YceI